MKAFRALLLVGLLAGCGVQADGAPRALPPDQVPEELLAPSSTADAPASPEGGILRTVWLVDNEGCLVETERRVAGPSIVASVVDSLLDGADDAEAADGHEGGFGGELRGFGDGQEVVAFPQGSVLG